MGSLALPAAGSVYLDANGFIYSVKRVAPYVVVLDAFWRDIRARGLSVLTSELTLLETLGSPSVAVTTRWRRHFVGYCSHHRISSWLQLRGQFLTMPPSCAQ